MIELLSGDNELLCRGRRLGIQSLYVCNWSSNRTIARAVSRGVEGRFVVRVEKTSVV